MTGRIQIIWKKLCRYAQQAGQQTVYAVLLMYYAFRRKDTPHWAKNIIAGALGYFLAPFDAIPDLTPILGYTDDFGVLSFGLVAVAAYINTEVRLQARRSLKSLFGEIDFASIKAVEQQL